MMRKKILMIATACIWAGVGLLILDYSIDGQYKGMVFPAFTISVKTEDSQTIQAQQEMAFVQRNTPVDFP